MKPIILEMTAFGSYAQNTIVDFRKLTHNLYLITGDTGAGKTTIFDGIMIALYGEASGEGEKKSRTFEMMHCDYVEKSVNTEVTLTFEHRGKTHKITRIFHFKKKRNSGEYEKTTPQATFWEEGKAVITKSDTVNRRIEELLGMNASQFRKIVMLAQGEFKKFLDADSEDKNKILGELFDNSAYVYFQEMFDKARGKLEKRRFEEGIDRIRRAMEDFEQPAGLTPEEAEVYTAGHSGLAQALETLAGEDRKKEGSLKEQICKYQKQAKTLYEEFGKAGEQNKKIDELSQKEEALKAMQEKTADMEQLEEQADQVEKALHKVRPKAVLFENAKKIYHNTAKDIEKLTAKLASLDQIRTEKMNAWEQCRLECEPSIRQLESSINEMKQALSRYDDLEATFNEQKKAITKIEESKNKWQASEKKKALAEHEIEEIEEKITSLDGIEATVERLSGELRKATENLGKLTDKGGICEQIDEIHRQEENQKTEQAKLLKLAEKAAELEQAYHAKYQAFINGQAGVLAKNLERELEEKGEAICPVCKTQFRSENSHCFAKTVEEIPDQKDVDKAKKHFESKDQERAEQSEKTVALETRIQGLKEKAVDGLRELVPDCPGWEALENSKYLSETIESYQNRKEESQISYQKATEREKEWKRLKKTLPKKREQLQEYEQDMKRYQEQEQKSRQESEKLAGTIEGLKKTLDLIKFPHKESALKQKSLWEKEKVAHTKKMEQAKEEYDRANQSYTETSAALTTKKSSLPGFEKDKDTASEQLNTAITESGFDSLEEVHNVLNSVRKSNFNTETKENTNILTEADSKIEKDIEKWLKSKTKELTDYQNDLKNTETSVQKLKEETQGWEKTNLEELKDEITTLERAQTSFQEQLRICQRQLENHQKAAKAVQEANEMLRSTEAAWKRLDSLADLAAGKRNAEGGKLSFDRYVMGYVFREVLEMANQRLDLISGGRYELIHEINVQRDNAIAGLEISVLDMTTGKSRPSSSLSGGESFFVSLALALGLSDVVQNHAGGTQLDALFIDEGFGTLDSDVLDKAMSVLNQLTEGHRLVGIISHVARLEESIPQQIRVKNGREGSSLEIVN